MKKIALFSAFMVSMGLSASADVSTLWVGNAKLSAAGATAKSWNSSETAIGAASILLDKETGTIEHLSIYVSGLNPSVLANAGPDGRLGPIHIHNYPQGGPDFFVLHLPADITPTANGFVFSLTDWVVEPAHGAGQNSAEFVISEILSGNTYIGLHTSNMLCENPDTKESVSCAAPATALSGTIEQGR